MNVPFSMISQKEEMQEANTFCVKHLHNISYRYCEICQKLVCDKCIREEHFTHRTITITNDFQSNKYILQLLKNYKNEMSKTVQLLSQSFKNLAAGVQTKNDLNSKKQMILQYFLDELELIKEHTQQLKENIDNLNTEIFELIELYKVKFNELFVTLHDNYSSLVNSMNESKQYKHNLI